MNKSKFSLADVLAVLASIAFGFVSFLGANFINIGNKTVWGMSHTTGCIAIAVFISVLLLSTALGAKFLKGTNSNFKASFIGEMILLILFGIFALFFATKTSPFSHYFAVTAQKTEIKSKLQTSTTQAKNMFAAYEKYAENRENLYKQKLRSVSAAKNTNPTEYNEYGFNGASGVSDVSQINTKMFSVHADLFPTNYSDTITNNGIKEVAIEWLKDSDNTISNWKPIGIVHVVNDIDEKSKEWLNTLVTLSKVREQGEQTSDFEYNLSFDNVKTYFTEFNSTSLISIVFTLVAYILMLLSWVVTKRSTRFPGFNFLFGGNKSNSNEL